MSVIVDTGVLYAYHDEDANRHEVALEAMKAVVSGKFGRPIVTDYIYGETVTLTLSNTSDPARAVDVGDRLLGRDGNQAIFDLVVVDRTLFETARETHSRYSDQGLSFADAVSVALVERGDADRLLAFDDDFDGVVERVDPQYVEP